MPCLGSQKICLSREIIFILHATDQAQPLIYFSTGYIYIFFFQILTPSALRVTSHAMNSVLNSERNQNINYACWPLNPSMLVPGSPLQIHLSIIWIER